MCTSQADTGRCKKEGRIGCDNPEEVEIEDLDIADLTV